MLVGDKVKMEKTIDIDDFMSLFVAVSFLQEQRFFNISNLKNYLIKECGLTEEESNKIDAITNEMIYAGMISPVVKFNGLFKIDKKIPFKEIVFEKHDKLNEMINFFYSYYGYDFEKSKTMDEINTNIKK